MNSTKGDNTPTNTKDLKELLLDHFVNSMPVEVDRDYASVLLDRVLQQAVNKAEVTMWGKTTKAMMDILQENFHYRLMCGEVRDPDGKIDVMSEFAKYQELEPERKKFSEYLEGLKIELNRDETPNQVEGK